jgi:hypothetical protein
LRVGPRERSCFRFHPASVRQRATWIENCYDRLGEFRELAKANLVDIDEPMIEA